MRVQSNAFSPLPGGGRAGVTVLFAVESPDAAGRRNVTAQFASGLPGTLGRSAGPVLAALGVVPLSEQSEVGFRERPSSATASASIPRSPSPSCRPDQEASRDRCRCKRDDTDVATENPGGPEYCGVNEQDVDGLHHLMARTFGEKTVLDQVGGNSHKGWG
jgi:hypothetical protein